MKGMDMELPLDDGVDDSKEIVLGYDYQVLREGRLVEYYDDEPETFPSTLMPGEIIKLRDSSRAPVDCVVLTALDQGRVETAHIDPQFYDGIVNPASRGGNAKTHEGLQSLSSDEDFTKIKGEMLIVPSK